MSLYCVVSRKRQNACVVKFTLVQHFFVTFLSTSQINEFVNLSSLRDICQITLVILSEFKRIS